MGLSTHSSQVTPELFSRRSIMLGQTEKTSKMHNVTQPISNAQCFSKSILYHEETCFHEESICYISAESSLIYSRTSDSTYRWAFIR